MSEGIQNPVMMPHCIQKLDFDRESLFKNSTSPSSNYESPTADDGQSSGSSESINKDKEIERIHVHLRLRPTKKQPTNHQCYTVDVENCKLIAKDQPNHSILNKDITEKHYKFTSILDENVDQIEVYDKAVRPILNDPFNERGATFLTYGCSSSGKTYTILGDKSPGLVPRAISQIFYEYQTIIVDQYPFVQIVNENVKLLDDDEVNSEIKLTNDFITENRKLNPLDKKKIKALKNSWIDSIPNDHDFQSKNFESNTHLVIWISFVEIYNEKIIDLLDMKKQASNTLRPLKIFSNNGNSYIRGLTNLNVSSAEEALEILQYGLKRVNYAATGINSNSSRSHTIFTISLISVKDGSYQSSVYKFCDLAGAERIKKTGNTGDRLKEAGGINNSLLVLGRCLEIVQHNQNLSKNIHESKVPVRDSKLTFLLQSSLLGLEKFVMIVNILPKIEFFEENLNVLNFASIAVQIVVKKTIVRKRAVRNSRYSFFTNNQLNATKANSYLASSIINESDNSLNNYSFVEMTTDELRDELHIKNQESILYREEVIKAKKEILELQKLHRQEMEDFKEQHEKNMEEYYAEREVIAKHYLNKKLESQELHFQKEIKQMNQYLDEMELENEELLEENRKLKGILNSEEFDTKADKENEADEETKADKICISSSSESE